MAITIKQLMDAINQVAGGSTSSADALAEEVAAQERMNDVLERQKKIIEAKSDSAEKAKELNKIEIEQLEALQKRRESEIKAAKRSNKVSDTVLARMEAEQAKRAKKIEALKQDTANTDKNTAAKKSQSSAIKSVSGSIAKQISVYGQHNLVNLEMIDSIAKTVKEAGLFGAAFGVLKGIVSGFINTTIAFTFSVDSANAAISKQTGLSRSNSAAITQNAQAMAYFGVTVSDLVSQTNALVPTFTDFTKLSMSSKRAIAETGALLEKNGVAAGDFSSGMQLATKAMSMNADQATATQRDLADFATIIGVTPQQMAADFAGAGSSLAKFGSDGVRAFKDLAITSKTTGLAIEKLLRVTEKFDTFEGAAEQAGMLNAALGGNFVNAMDLLMETDPASRFEMIRDAIMNTGLSFDDMSYYQRKFYAEASGLDDVNDLALLMSGNFDDLAGSQQKSSAEILKLQERTKAFQDIGERFKTLLMSLIPIFTPLIDGLTKFAVMLEKNKDLTKALGKAIMIFAGIFIATKLVGMIVGMAKGLGLLSVTQKKAAVGSMRGAKAFALQAVAAAALGFGLGAAFSGAAELVTAFKDVGDNAPYAIGAIVAVTGVVFGFAKALKFIGASSAGAGKAIVPLAIALGTFYLAMEVAKPAAKAFGEMFGMIAPKTVASLSHFFYTLGTQAIGINVAAAGILLLTPAMYALSSVIDGMSVKRLDSINSLLNSIADVELENIKALRTEIEAIMKSIDSTSTLNLTTLSTIASTAALPLAFAAAGTAAIGAAGATTNVAAPEVNVKVYVDGKEITAKAVRAVDDNLKAQAFGSGAYPTSEQ